MLAMSLKNVDFEAAFRRLAERWIEDAMKEGKFDNLSGAGKPLELEPMPADENARMTWWMLRIMRNNDFTPHEVRWRKALDHLRDELAAVTDESRLERLVAQINALIQQINTLGTNALNLGVAGVNLETERQRLRLRLPK
jgi:hypothetical protein